MNAHEKVYDIIAMSYVDNQRKAAGSLCRIFDEGKQVGQSISVPMKNHPPRTRFVQELEMITAAMTNIVNRQPDSAVAFRIKCSDGNVGKLFSGGIKMIISYAMEDGRREFERSSPKDFIDMCIHDMCLMNDRLKNLDLIKECLTELLVHVMHYSKFCEVRIDSVFGANDSKALASIRKNPLVRQVSKDITHIMMAQMDRVQDERNRRKSILDKLNAPDT